MDKNLEYEPVRGAHILMIVNPVSGRISGEHTADKLEAWLKENGAAVDRFETTETENGSGYTAKLAENDYARVVVLGGDGTLNAVLNGMLHRAPHAHHISARRYHKRFCPDARHSKASFRSL